MGWKRVLRGLGIPRKTPSTRELAIRSVSALVIMVGAGFLGMLGGYYWGTGVLPFAPDPEVVLPPAIVEQMESGEVAEVGEVVDFIEVARTELEEYGIGFNCVESAIMAARGAHWEGLPAEVVKIDFRGDSVSHMILGFPTSDAGFVFVNPIDGSVITPRIGGRLGNDEVVGIYLMQIDWFSLSDWEPGESVDEL